MSQHLTVRLDPAKVQSHTNNLVKSRNHWQNISLGLFFFILVFVTLFYHTYRNTDQRLKEISKKQERQTALLEKLNEEKNQRAKKSTPRYRTW